VPEEIRIVAVDPDEDQVHRRHELGHEAAARCRAGEGVRADAEPAVVVLAGVVDPELFLLDELLFLEEDRPPPRLERLGQRITLAMRMASTKPSERL
jgi:hypothetical protein